MRWMLVAIVPLLAAWEPVRRDVPPDDGGVWAQSITTIVDIIRATANFNETGALADPNVNDYMVSFADADVLAGCRIDAGPRAPADSPNELARLAGTYRGRFVKMRSNFLALALWARAHNAPVLVRLDWTNNGPGGCEVKWLQTCFDPNNCQPPPEP